MSKIRDMAKDCRLMSLRKYIQSIFKVFVTVLLPVQKIRLTLHHTIANTKIRNMMDLQLPEIDKKNFSTFRPKGLRQESLVTATWLSWIQLLKWIFLTCWRFLYPYVKSCIFMPYCRRFSGSSTNLSTKLNNFMPNLNLCEQRKWKFVIYSFN